MTSKYTVHNCPTLLKPFLWIYGWSVGIGFFLHQNLLRLLCNVEYVGQEHLDNHPAHVRSVWHEDLAIYFITHSKFRKPHIMLTFPLWYMKPVHVMKKLIGIRELAFGASGIDGKMAMNQVIERLKDGWSTMVAPDGPKGPLKEIKDGVLLMSIYSGAPVIPIHFSLSRSYRISGWDRKRYPKIFSKVIVTYGEPIFVTHNTKDVSRESLALSMNGTPKEIKR